MTNLLLIIIIFLLLCHMFGTANVLATIVGLLVLIVIVWAFVAAIHHIWKCLK